jgi:hypothetical protein
MVFSLLTPFGEKAVEGYRIPRRFATHMPANLQFCRCRGISSASEDDLRDSRLPFARTFLSFAHLNYVQRAESRKLKTEMTSVF